jgi:hypothetical protein
VIALQGSRYLLGAGSVAMAGGYALLGAVAEFAWVLLAVALIAGGAGLLLSVVVFGATLPARQRRKPTPIRSSGIEAGCG